MNTGETRPPSEQILEVDTVLRSSLKPDPATVDRLVSNALAASDPPPTRWRGRRLVALPRWQRLAAATAILAAVTLPFLWSRRPEQPPSGQTRQARPQPATAAPAVLRISNEHGQVTVTTPAGSKMIVLSPMHENPAPGDAS